MYWSEQLQFQNTVPSSIEVGDYLEIGTYIGKVGNSGTSFTPHIHLGIVQYKWTHEIVLLI